jgi:metal-sulfur cluster biosynthetic enzyme
MYDYDQSPGAREDYNKKLTLKCDPFKLKINPMNIVTILVIALIALVVGIVVAVRKQSSVTRSYTPAETLQDTRAFEDSAKRMEKTVTEQLAEKARDPRLASMTQEDLVYEVLKECFDPEIPLNIVDLGLICDVKVLGDVTTVKLTMTSPQCPSHVAISEDVKTKLDDAGFPNPKVEVVWEPAWSPQRISEAGRKSLGI